MAQKRYAEHLGNKNSYLWKQIHGFKAPYFCLNSDYFNIGDYLYDSEEIEHYIEIIDIKNKELSTYTKNIYETFLLRLELHKDKIPLLEKSTYTKEKWLSYVNSRISKVNTSKPYNFNTAIKTFLNITFLIEEEMNKYNAKEIYELTANQINLWFINIQIQHIVTKLYIFLKEVYKDVNLKLQLSNNQKDFFDFKKIIKYRDPIFENKTLTNINEEVYDVDTYIEFFKYCIDIPYHLGKVIRDEPNITYLSAWLYYSLHLNNAWRKSDILNFPRLYLKDLLDEWNISDIKWFKTNKISVERSRRIISRITQFDYAVSKTGVFNHFFCSDKLGPTIATILLLFECIYITTEHSYNIKYSEPTMLFLNCKNNEPTKMIAKIFFHNINIPDFHFSSKKMNKTILTLVYDTASTIVPSGYNELLLPKYMRAHKEEKSTLHYIDFSIEQLEFLSCELFERGEFGFISTALMDLISDKSQGNLTEKISLIKKNFGDYRKIEATLGLMNSFDDEEKEITEMLNQYSLDECMTILNKIMVNELPSKKSHIQCLFSQSGCKFPGTECEHCKYSIPNIYILNIIGNKIKREMNEYEQETILFKKIKLSVSIHKSADVLIAAIKKYGKDYVYNCMDIDRVDFIRQFNKIAEVSVLIKEMQKR